MVLSSWLCTNSSKNMLVKIVHPGGHVELHDRPVLAAEIMLRNPTCVVAYPHVFKQPWAIVAPDTALNLGQKYYVVPVNTIRKLQRLSFKYSPSTVEENRSSETPKDDHIEGDPRGNVSEDKCFICLLAKTKRKGNDRDSRVGTWSSSSSISSESKGLNRKRTNSVTKGSTKTSVTLDHWQPNLESITEE